MKKKQPLVSVIINTVDRPDDLKRCLKAVLGQTYRNFEIVVVNNGTGKETRELLKSYQQSAISNQLSFRVIEDKTKKLSYLFNLGWKNTDPKAEIFAYCADDTEPDKDWLFNIVKYLEAHPECGAVSGPTLATTKPPGEMFALYDLMKKTFITRVILRLYEYFVMEDKTFEPGRWCESGAFTMGAGIPQPEIKEPIEIELLTSGNMGVRRKVMEKIGGFDENFYFNHADGDLFIRILKAGYKNIFHPKVKVLHHMRFGPTRFPEIMGRDTAFYYLKDVRPKSLHGWIGYLMNLGVFLSYWVFKAIQIRDLRQLRGISGFLRGIYDFFATQTPERDELLKTIAVIGGFATLFAQAVRRGFQPGMPAFGDAWPFPPSPAEAFRTFFAAYDHRNPNINMPAVTVISFLTLFEGIFGFLLGGNMILVARLFYFYLPLPLTFLSMYWFLGRFVSSRPAKFIASFIYSANFVSIGELLGGFVSNQWVQVLFPLILYSLYRRKFLSFSLLFSLAYILSDHVIIFLLPFFLIFLAVGFLKESWSGLFSRIFFVAGSVVSVIFLTLPYTFYYFKIAFPFLGGAPLRREVLEFLIRNVHDTYRYYTLGNILRLGGASYIDLYNLNNLLVRLGFIIPLLAFSWTIWSSDWERKRFRVGLLFSGLAITTIIFVYLTHKYISLPLFVKFPFLFRFRNPARPTLFLALSYTPLIALSVEGFINFVDLKLKGWVKSGLWLVSLVIGGALIFYFKPFFSGDYAFSRNRGATYTIPERYYKSESWLEKERKKEGFFRTLWLPYNHEEVEMKIRYVDPFSYSVPMNYGAYVQNEYLQHMKRSYQYLAKGAPEAADSFAKAGVKYFILNKESKDSDRARFEYGYQTPWLLGAVGDWERVLSGIESLKPLTEMDGFRIYENQSFYPETVDRELAGLPPENMDDLRRTKSITMLISSLTLFGVLGGMVYFNQTKKR